MFNVDVAEYVRLSYQTLEDACQAHADAAERLARGSAVFKAVTLGTTGVATALTIAAAWHSSWHVAAAIASASAFAACAAYVGFDQQPRIHGHRACSTRLWLVCEEYRELIAEMGAGHVDPAVLRPRRHALMQEAAAIFEHVAPADRYTFQVARRALGSRSGAPAASRPTAAPAQ